MRYSSLHHLEFGEIDISDPFFDTLKEDYDGFENWFAKKVENNEDAYVQFNKNGNLQGFLYIKMEESDYVNDVNPSIRANKILKVGTFKINAHGTKMGEQFLKVLFDYAVATKADVCYVTVFEKHKGLISLISKYGFIQWGTKGTGDKQELVYLKNMRSVSGDLWMDYPLVNYRGHRKYLLSVYPKYHSKLFPESILTNESRSIIKDISYTNSIRKNYVCAISGVENLEEGDIIVIYRTSEQGRGAEYTSVATTICTVTGIRLQETFSDFEDFYTYTSNLTIFDKEDLLYWYKRGGLKVISLVYNFSLKKRIIRHDLIGKIGLSRDNYWGFFELSDNEFINIVKQGKDIEYLV